MKRNNNNDTRGRRLSFRPIQKIDDDDVVAAAAVVVLDAKARAFIERGG